MVELEEVRIVVHFDIFISNIYEFMFIYETSNNTF